MNASTSLQKTRSRKAIALVVVLAILVLVTGLVVAFFSFATNRRSITAADAAGARAEAIARDAIDTVTADLVSEMQAGSATSTPPFKANSPTKLLPEPALSGNVSGPETFNLLKQSIRGKALYSGGVIRASNINTSTNPSISGRSIAAARWSLPALFTNGYNLPDNATPDWIYLSRNGSNPTDNSNIAKNRTSSNTTDFVVGRYAFQAYDISGLLDMNAAGFDPTGTSATTIGAKGSLLLADLRAIPGMSGLPDNQIQSIVHWRNKGSWADLTSLLDWGSRYGWLRPLEYAADNDNIFLSRSDLNHFLTTKIGAPATKQSLPYLTRFSRQLNAPSWAPTTPPSSSFDYAGTQDTPTSINRRLPGVTVQSAFTRRDQTMAVVGEPLMKNRFPLTKINLLSSNGDATQIAQYFGLQRNPDGYRWDYTQFKGGSQIKTLNEVSAESREPNFFEVLQAAMLSKSVGESTATDFLFTNTAFDNDASRQVMRVGACIIDQWDTDSDPTVIAGSPDYVGIENLPYFQVVSEARFRRRETGGPPMDSNAASFYLFQLWNPHLNVLKNDIAAGNFRIVADGTIFANWSGSGTAPYGAYNYSSVARDVNETNYALTFTVSATEAFAEPRLLRPGIASAATLDSQDTYTVAGASLLGLHAGTVSLPYLNQPDHAKRYNTGGGFFRPSPNFTFKLQKKINGNWVTYDFLPSIVATHGFLINNNLYANSPFYHDSAHPYYNTHFALSDPRTKRFGMKSSSAGSPTVDSFPTRPTYSAPNSPGTLGPLFTSDGPANINNYASLSINDSSQPTYYNDSDSVLRKADGGAPMTAGSTGRPLMLNRPFQSVGEMGYAFRDDPWKNLDLYRAQSADNALLDLFTLSEARVRAGVVNLNSAPAEVLTAVLKGAAPDVQTGATITNPDVIAAAIRTKLGTRSNPSTVIATPADIPALIESLGTTLAPTEKRQREVIARALADVSNTRTWNVLIDVFAQTGRLSANASGLDQFIVQGERRVWVSLAIDRVTGEIVDQQLETVEE